MEQLRLVTIGQLAEWSTVVNFNNLKVPVFGTVLEKIHYLDRIYF